MSWHLSKPPSTEDLAGSYNWRTDSHIARGGYFDDLASHGLDLISFLLGDIKVVQGLTSNQQGLYGAYDAITANWMHYSGVTVLLVGILALLPDKTTLLSTGVKVNYVFQCLMNNL